MKLGSNPQSRKHDIVIQELKDEVLIYDLIRNKALCLNQTSAMIWQECDGTKSVTEISQLLSRKLKSNVSEDIIWLALNQFKTDNLLTNNDLTTPLVGLNRREIVKRIGFASMVALPIISTLVAPHAINAQSFGGSVCGCNLSGQNARDAGCPCNDNNDCCGVCQGGNVCGGPTAPSAPTDAPCCTGTPLTICGPNAAPGLEARPQGAPCNDNNDCCGVCQAGGVCGAPTAPAQPFAAGCCPPL